MRVGDIAPTGRGQDQNRLGRLGEERLAREPLRLDPILAGLLRGRER